MVASTAFSALTGVVSFLRNQVVSFARNRWSLCSEIRWSISANSPELFENYIEQYLFPVQYYDLLEKTHNYSSNSRHYVESSLKPDFKYRDRYTGREFFIEAKFRTDLYQDKFVWCNDQQLARYQHINLQTPVFLLLGIGDKANWPEGIALIPLYKAKYKGLYPSVLDKFIIELERPVTSKILWNR